MQSPNQLNQLIWHTHPRPKTPNNALEAYACRSLIATHHRSMHIPIPNHPAHTKTQERSRGNSINSFKTEPKFPKRGKEKGTCVVAPNPEHHNRFYSSKEQGMSSKHPPKHKYPKTNKVHLKQNQTAQPKSNQVINSNSLSISRPLSST